MISDLNILNFLEFPANVPILDVRSPGEYNKGHIPGAYSVPLFSNEERALIGTAYKQVSREEAIKIGLKAFGPKLLPIVEEAEKIAGSSKQLRVHCWRGGMRSGAVAWLLDLYGFKVYVLKGGYKAYRHHVLSALEKQYNLKILGGCTGCNKTGLLNMMAKQGYSVIDLEGLAAHKGSAFGNLDLYPQPSQEHFENMLAFKLENLSKEKPNQPIWLEAESQRIGLINIPLNFFKLMRSSPLFLLEIPFETRLKHIVKEYGNWNKEKLINAIVRIKKKLGGLEAKTAIGALVEDNVEEAFRILLTYYDKLYLKTFKTEDNRPIETIVSHTTDASENLNKILGHVHTN